MARFFAITAGVVVVLTVFLSISLTNGEPIDGDAVLERKVTETFLADPRLLNPVTEISAVSHDSKRVAYGARVGGKYFVVVDGIEGKPCEGMVVAPTFSPDSKRVAYGAQSGEKHFVVLDGKEGKSYDGIGGGTIIFSPDSKRVAYGAHADGKWFVVVDGTEGPPYDGVTGGTIVFSPDSARVAYGAQAGGKRFVVVGEKEGKPCDSILAAPIFSPDSARVAYGVRAGGACFVMVDGKEGKPYDDFCRGGRIVFDSPDSLHYLVLKNGGGIYLVEEVIVRPDTRVGK